MSDRVSDAREEDTGLEDTKFDDNRASKEAETWPTESISQPEEEEELAPKVEAAAPRAASGQHQQADPTTDSKFFAIRTTGGQERVVAGQIQVRVNAKKIG